MPAHPFAHPLGLLLRLSPRLCLLPLRLLLLPPQLLSLGCRRSRLHGHLLLHHGQLLHHALVLHRCLLHRRRLQRNLLLLQQRSRRGLLGNRLDGWWWRPGRRRRLHSPAWQDDGHAARTLQQTVSGQAARVG